jgi:Holliday junction DNA helicase RuvA
MISSLNGIIKETAAQLVSIDLGPITCTLTVPDGTIYQIGSPAAIHTHMHWNSDNGPTFYGFQAPLDRTVFQLIISCSGIGPKIGLTALSALGSGQFLEAVQMGDTKKLSSISGIGTKKAEQIILQLKDKVAQLISAGQIVHGSAKLEQWHTVTLALESLNYSRSEISRTLEQLKTGSLPDNMPFDQLMRKALALLSK